MNTHLNFQDPKNESNLVFTNHSNSQITQLNLGPIILDLSNRTLKGPNKIIELTTKQFEILIYFIEHSNKVVTKETIVEHIWGNSLDSIDNYDFIYTHIKNLRKKLKFEGCEEFIKVIYGVGYKFVMN